MTGTINSLWVNKSDQTQTEWHDKPMPELAEGQVVLEVEKYALTANNITYAVVGDGFGYWNFFPTGDEGHGIVPVWGFAKVAQSKNPDIAVGERVYGYLPMASHLLISPVHVSDAAFLDGAEHRQGLATVYNQYHRLDDSSSPEQEDARALFEPLFLTSFLIEDFMRRSKWHGADAVVMTSASSKTAMALAAVAKSESAKIQRIGLTSEDNRDFVLGTGLYDEVLAYEDLAQADASQATVSVDFAGNSGLLTAIHDHWQDKLKFSSMVGATHIKERSGTGELKGPKPVMFFAPTAAESVIKEMGPDAFRTAVAEQFSSFSSAMAGQLEVEHLSGPEALQEAFLEMLGGKVAPSRGLVCSPS